MSTISLPVKWWTFKNFSKFVVKGKPAVFALSLSVKIGMAFLGDY